ncbi:type II toxin-antitoxin system RelE/ParE family toxin [Anatilimnocola floriformis]|uniref:type II toxin-antitoxin system RelE/ParE family toxin n=1 Tax=Anatilimnocola floriformis TaxID=2948575 RepID=UPI0036F2E1A5
MIVEFNAEAGDEFDRATEWYRHQSAKAANSFVLKVQEAISGIVADPQRFERVKHGCQRCGLRPFPYSLIFLASPSKIIIVAVAHGSRRPGYWHSRV